MQEGTTFDASKHLTKVSGKDYLEVKWRLVWLRSEHPDASIDTTLLEHMIGKFAVVRAVIQLPNGGGYASGLGSETMGTERGSWPDYLEKAETKAIGRALAALGYGTQFCQDYDFGGEHGLVVDSPVTQQRQPRREVYQEPDYLVDDYDDTPRATPSNGSYDKSQRAASDAQRKMLFGKGRGELNWTPQQVKDFVQQQTGEDVNSLTMAHIDFLVNAMNKIKADMLAGIN